MHTVYSEAPPGLTEKKVTELFSVIYNIFDVVYERNMKSCEVIVGAQMYLKVS